MQFIIGYLPQRHKEHKEIYYNAEGNYLSNTALVFLWEEFVELIRVIELVNICWAADFRPAIGTTARAITISVKPHAKCNTGKIIPVLTLGTSSLAAICRISSAGL